MLSVWTSRIKFCRLRKSVVNIRQIKSGRVYVRFYDYGHIPSYKIHREYLLCVLYLSHALSKLDLNGSL